MTHRYVTGRVEDPLVDKNAARRGEIFEHSAVHGVSGHR
jgi:hypothetical protein